jgi:hypothetical protein
MKLPSLTYLAQNAGRTFLRFPLSIICGAAGSAISIYMWEQHEVIQNYFPFVNLLLTFGLGISLFFSADVLSYAKNFPVQKQMLLRGAVAVILVGIYFSFPGLDSTQNTSVPYVRYTIYSIAVHLLVAFIPFLEAGKLNGFWQYNRILFVRILAAMLYSGFLYAGLALALGSLDFLFDVDLHDELYLDLFYVIAGVFNTWFFLAGVPSEFAGLDENEEYPRGIKIFSQYVLLTLLCLYLVILYIYACKIVFLWSWPKGLVSYLVACVAVLGILTLLLIHPYGNLPGNSWIKKFSRAYYVILLPLIVLLFIAIGMRVSDYGVTINRYVIVLLGVWLTIVCAYFISGRQNIKFIPISLAVILMLVCFGYWGIFSVSERSQVSRLRAILEQEGILKDGKIQNEVMWLHDSLPKSLIAVDRERTNDGKMVDSLHNEVASIMDYLDDHHGFASIRNWYSQDLDSIVKENNKVKTRWYKLNEARAYMETMGLEYGHKYEDSRGSTYFSFSAVRSNILDVRTWDYLLDVQTYYYGGGVSYMIEGESYQFLHPESVDSNAWLASSDDSVKFELVGFVKALEKKYGQLHDDDIPQSDMLVYGESRKFTAEFQIKRIACDQLRDTLQITNLYGNILLRKKK